ncbi:MAG: hypothetical protein KJ023_02670 [Burkholderiaceae bacterium]|nr:hypothetical protein [Burkholderiaceae bacterium]
MRPARQTALIALLLAAALALTWLKPLDTLGERQVEAGLKRALVAFAAARTLNAVLSALQEASVSLQVGAGIAIKPGAVLEPLDDVVEQFSNLMFVATASFAVQRLLIELLSAWPVCVALSLLLVAWAALAWRRRGLPAWLPRLAVALLMLRLATPVLALAGEAVHAAVLARPYLQHAERLHAIDAAAARPAASGASGASSAPGATGTPGTLPAESLLDRLKALATRAGDIPRQVEALRERAQDIVESLVRLGAVFVVQTVVLPLLYVAFLLWLHRALFAPRPPAAPGR